MAVSIAFKSSSDFTEPWEEVDLVPGPSEHSFVADGLSLHMDTASDIRITFHPDRCAYIGWWRPPGNYATQTTAVFYFDNRRGVVYMTLKWPEPDSCAFMRAILTSVSVQL